MIVKLASPDENVIQAVSAALAAMGGQVRHLALPYGTFLAALGLEHPALKPIQAMAGVAWARPAGSKPILAARELNPGGSRVRLGAVSVGGEADAFVGVSGFKHVRGQLLDCGRDAGDERTFLAEHGGAVFDDR